MAVTLVSHIIITFIILTFTTSCFDSPLMSAMFNGIQDIH